MLLTLIPTSPKTKNPSAKAKIKKNTQARELSVSKSVQEPLFNCFNSLIHQLFHWFLLGASDKAEETRQDLWFWEAHMPHDEPATSKQGHPVSTGSTAVKGTGFGVK